MDITAVCPYCRTSYKLQPSLRGKSIHCPNERCRKIFVVENGAKESGSVEELVTLLPAEIDLPPAPSSNHVGDLVPLLPSEALPDLTPIDHHKAPAAASWLDAPPPVRRAGEPESPPVKTGKTMRRPTPATEPVRLNPKPITTRDPEPKAPRTEPEPPVGAWDPPPVRRGGDGERAVLPTEEPVQPPVDEEAAEPKRRRAKLAMVAMLVFVFGSLGGGGWWVFNQLHVNQEELSQQAFADYQNRTFGLAEAKFLKLIDRFPDSDQLDKYQFMQRLSSLREKLSTSDDDPDAYFNELEGFQSDFKSDPLFKEFAQDFRATVVGFSDKLVVKFAQPNDETPLKYIERHAKLVDATKGFTPAENDKIKQNAASVMNVVEKWKNRIGLLAQLDGFARGRVDPGVVKRARDLVAGEPDLKDDPEAAKKIEQLYDAHFKGITFTPEQAELAKAPKEEDALPSFLIDPLIANKGAPGRAPAKDSIVLALVRGVLYGMNKSNGKVKWVFRVGVDTTTLPLRVPPSEASPERILVLSSDTETLTALDGDGNALWQYRLDSPCLGKPVVDGRRAYLCTFDGKVHEIELVAGRLLGRYDLGQRLSMGGTFDPRTKRLFVAADDSCVYVLDTQGKRCESILYTWHPSGSLRSEPMVTQPQGGLVPSFLVLNQSDGLDTSRLRIYTLPIAHRRAAPVSKQDLRLPGWTWFTPHLDSEKITLVSDAGILGLIGIKQPYNNDDPLFSLLPGKGKGSESMAGASLDGVVAPDPHGRGRAQVVHVQGEDMWVLVHGKLQRIRVAWTEARGPRVVSGWPAALELGSPLHDGQVDEDRLGRSTLFVVTQSLASPSCLVTAVDDEDGKPRWQRQLGLVCQGAPLVLAPVDGKPTVLAMDQSGSLVAFDTQQVMAAANALWQSRGKILANGFEENPLVAPVLRPGLVPGSAIQIACPGKGENLVIRQIDPMPAGGWKLASEVRGSLPAPLTGTPARVGAKLILPLANGVLARVDLPWNAKILEGPNWRARSVNPQALGHVTALDGDRFLTTDGGRGLTVWEWGNAALWKSFPANSEPPTIELSHRIVAPPLVLPGAQTTVIVADSAGIVTSLNLDNAGRLTTGTQWNLKGQVTAGPFLDGVGAASRIGVIVDRRRLVWIDPAKAEKAWEFRTANDKGIVGLPQRVGKELVLVDQSGHYVAINPTTGQPVGPGYRLNGSMAPAASPVAFDADRLFVPLTDGTILLLPLKNLR